MEKRHQKKRKWEKWLFEITVKMNLFCGGTFSKAVLCQVAPAGAFVSEKLTFLEISDMPIFKNVYFLIFGHFPTDGNGGGGDGGGVPTTLPIW